MSWDLVCEFERVKDKMIHEDSLLKIVNYSFYGGGVILSRFFKNRIY